MTTMTLIGTPDPDRSEDSLTITIKRSDVRDFDNMLDKLAAAWADKDALVIEYGDHKFLTDFNLTTEFKGI